MKHLKSGLVIIVLALLLSACASTPEKNGWFQKWGDCAVVGAATGGMAGGVFEEGEGAAVGAAAGFVVGGLICAMGDSDRDGVKNHADDCPDTPAGGIVDDRGCEIDSDGDGVVDRLDNCPGTPAGATVDEHGCELDSDGDGVIDRLDRCPGTPAGTTVDEHGCELDSDGDGVVDRLDKCPNTPKGTAVDNNGCPLAKVYELENVNFEFDSATLTAASTASLDGAVKILKRHSDMKVEIAGHTDSQGDAAYNQGLSERRAQAVADYLTAHGADAGNISVKGYGESEPVADNGTEAGRAENRRVELRHK